MDVIEKIITWLMYKVQCRIGKHPKYLHGLTLKEWSKICREEDKIR